MASAIPTTNSSVGVRLNLLKYEYYNQLKLDMRYCFNPFWFRS